MIEQINSYAITSGQPGIINEEAFTTLELVGKCGQKVNECIAQVNENTDDVSTMQVQYSAVRELAQTAVRTADEAKANSNEALEYSTAAMVASDEARRKVKYVEQNYTENLTGIFSLWEGNVLDRNNQYDPTFLVNLAQLISNALNNHQKYYDLTGSDPFGMNAQQKCFAVSLYDTQNVFSESGLFGFGRLRFTIIHTMAGLEIAQTDNADVIIWEYSQMVYGSPNLDRRGQFPMITANGTFGIPRAEYSANHQYDPQLFTKYTWGFNYSLDAQVI